MSNDKSSSQLKVNDYYKKKALKYFTKYTMLKKSSTNMRGGGKPVWLEDLIKEAKLIYDELSIKSKSEGEPKESIILSGSAALSLLLAYNGMDDELTKAFVDPYDSSKNNRPNDLDFIYQGTDENDNLNITTITIISENTTTSLDLFNREIVTTNKIPIKYNRKEKTAISSPKYEIEQTSTKPSKLLIKDFDLTNINHMKKKVPFTKLNYINIYGIKVLTPEKLLSIYNEEFDEKNINKIEQLDILNSKIKKDPLLEEKYRPISKDVKYIPEGYNERQIFSRRPVSKLSFDMEEQDTVIPVSKLSFDMEEQDTIIPVSKLSFDMEEQDTIIPVSKLSFDRDAGTRSPMKKMPKLSFD